MIDRDAASHRGATGRRAAWAFLALLAALLPAVLASAQADAAGAGLGVLWEAPAADAAPGSDSEFQRMRSNRVQLAKLAIALAATGVLAWGWALGRAGRPRAHSRVRDGALAGLAVAAFFGWWNFGAYHYPSFVHTHEVFNYYVGSKYFPELGYGRLYQCIAVADVEAGLDDRVRTRLMTDLGTYRLRGTRGIRARPELCKRHFSDTRWAAFAGDVGWFRSQMTPQAWEALQRDHGYNATPAWGILGSRIASAAPAGPGIVTAIVWIDPLLDILMWLVVAFTFGWRVMCIGVIYWGTNHPAAYDWIGGAFLRDDWLAALLIGVCLLYRGRSLAAGVLLGASSLLRVFPVLSLAGVGAAALTRIWRERRLHLEGAHLRLAAGALLTLAVSVPLSMLTTTPRAWLDFATNMSLHVGTPAENTVGLRTALSFHPESRLATIDAPEPGGDLGKIWKERRLRTLDERQVVLWVMVAAYLALLLRAASRSPDWVAAVLGTGAVPFLLEPTCYYTHFLTVWALLAARREALGVALCALSVAGWGAAAVSAHLDDVFALTSVAMLAFVVFATALFVNEPSPA